MHARSGLRGMAVCAALAGVAMLRAQAPEVVISGSELLEPVLAPIAARHNAHAARPVRLQLQGSRPGVRDLDAGRAAAALLVAAPGEDWSRAEGRRARPFAAQIVVVVVPEANAVRSFWLYSAAGMTSY